MKTTLNYDLDELNVLEAMKAQLIMSTTEINREYIMKVRGLGYNIAVGVAGLLKLVGVENANNMLRRANACTGDVCVCKLRRGLQVSFYIH